VSRRPPAGLTAGLAVLAALALTLAARQVTAPGRSDAGPTVFRGLAGPEAPSNMARETPTLPSTYGDGSASRLAVLLTDTDSAWLGLAHGLKSIGIPFRITTDYREALRHRVVLVYPIVSGRVLSHDALVALAAFPRLGGTLVAVNVLGGGLEEVFGFREALPARNRFAIRFTGAASSLLPIAGPQEAVIRLGNAATATEALGTYGYTDPASAPVAVYEDGTAAITERRVGQGRAYAVGLDLGDFILRGYNNREGWMARSYVNGYEPAIDMPLRLLREIYARGEPNAVLLGTVPFGRALSVLMTHDVDYAKSVANSIPYAEYERAAGVRATYFIQTKYVRDYNDIAFFDDRGVALLRKLAALGMDVGSHTVAHSRAFASFPLGSGREAFPSYRPFVRNRRVTDGGSILGELRVSRFLLETLVTRQPVVAFRAGELADPYALPQALAATGYRFSSSVTANDSLTHLPFQLTYARSVHADAPVFEFPVTVEDEAMPPLLARLGVAIDLAQQVSAYGGTFVVLIHPNIVGDKLEFEKGFVHGMRDRAWFGSVSEFGDWWAARNEVAVDATGSGADVRVRIRAPRRIDGLGLRLPAGWTVTSRRPSTVSVTPRGEVVVLGTVDGEAVLQCTVSTPRSSAQR
jgi:peptidoglycan/xylan/chitin deacetylase (PgdA/CDA1 family)